ncbi:CbaC protein [Natrinema saccharevitans]|uniref:CbaC protein n=1 Tax=Natrinema saccharevitans TaxID=301967 RepID=A0A1S8AZF7_9EURY|nr:CbaC protein [Natrinema saccharevitans]OLZ41986.1 CbaC protein [Natrinema saccharevitans]
MRISEGALLVVLAMLVPFIVELRTALSWFGIKLTILETLILGSVITLAVLVWAMRPEKNDTNGGSSRPS